MQSKHLTNTRQLEIDTNFLQISPSSTVKQYYNQNGDSNYNTENFILDNQQKSSRITNPSRKSISMISTAIFTIQNTLKTFILKQMFSAWSKISAKPTSVLEDLNNDQGQNYEGFSIQYENQISKANELKNFQGIKQYHTNLQSNFEYKHLPQSQIQSVTKKAYNPNLRISQDIYGEKSTNFRQDHNQSASIQNLRLCLNSPKEFENTIRDPNCILKALNSKIETNLSTGQHYTRLNLHVSQMKEISKAYSIQSKSNSSKSRNQKYQSLSQKSHDALSQSRAMILRDIAQKLKKENRRNSHSVIIDNLNIKKSRYQSNQHEGNQNYREELLQILKESSYIKSTPKPDIQSNFSLNDFEAKISSKLNRLQLMMSKIKREHEKIQGGPTIQKKKLKIDRNRKRQFEQQQLNQLENRFQEDNEIEFYLMQLQKIKRELNEVKTANANIWNYAKNVQSLRQRQYKDYQRILTQSIENERRKAKSFSNSVQNERRESSQKVILNQATRESRQIPRPVSYVQSHPVSNNIVFKPSSHPPINIAPHYHVPRQSHVYQRHMIKSPVQRFHTVSDRLNNYQRRSQREMRNSQSSARTGSIPIFFNNKIPQNQAFSLRQSLNLAHAPCKFSQQKNSYIAIRQARYPQRENNIRQKINVSQPYFQNKNINTPQQAMVRTSEAILSNRKVVSETQRISINNHKNIVFQNAPVQNNSSTNIVSGNTLAKDGSEMHCILWPFTPASRRQI